MKTNSTAKARGSAAKKCGDVILALFLRVFEASRLSFLESDMKWTTKLIVVAIGALSISIAWAQSRDDMNEWMKQAAPNENHQRLEALVGKWDDVIRFPAEPGKPWTQAKGTTEFRWAMGKRFLIEETKTTMMGEPFEWMGMHGYDNGLKQYVVAFIDNLGTGIDSMHGTWDEGSKLIVYVGESDEGGRKTKVKWVVKLGDPDRYGVEMFEVGGNGKDEKVLEIEATRAK
jgi:hypothetical protein